jgi:hypothetical protein
VQDLEIKNLKLNQLMDKKAFDRAENYQRRIQETLKNGAGKSDYDQYSSIARCKSPIDENSNMSFTPA